MCSSYCQAPPNLMDFGSAGLSRDEAMNLGRTDVEGDGEITLARLLIVVGLDHTKKLGEGQTAVGVRCATPLSSHSLGTNAFDCTVCFWRAPVQVGPVVIEDIAVVVVRFRVTLRRSAIDSGADKTREERPLATYGLAEIEAEAKPVRALPRLGHRLRS